MPNVLGIPSTDGGGKTEQTKEPEAAPVPETEKKEQPEDKKVLTDQVLVVFKKSRSEFLIPVYVSVRATELYFLYLFFYCRPSLQEDVPAGEDGSGGSEDSDSDEDDSDESSDESSEDEDDEEDEDEEVEEEEKDEPLSLVWPDTRLKQATYLFLLPIIVPLWLTVPDVRNQVQTQTHFWDQFQYLKDKS